MYLWQQALIPAVGLAVALAGCAAPSRPDASLGLSSETAGRTTQATRSERPAAPKRIIAAIMGDAHTVAQKLNPASYVPGIDTTDDRGHQRAQLAEAPPTIENGLWRVLPDGRMETTWKIRANARWHDGTPITTDDLLFTLKVVQDAELGVFRDNAFNSIEGVDGPDLQTITVRWRAPLVRADLLFSRSLALPLPRHLLEKPYTEEKATFLDLPYWSVEFVGSGPFKLREFVRGSHLTVAANDHYVLGRPKVDEIEVKFIPDSKTLMANLLAGTVELTLGRILSIEEAMQVRDQWRGGGDAYLIRAGAIQLHPQFLNPNPPLVANLQFRRALYHTIDRQELGNSLQGGDAIIANTFVVPEQPEYQPIEGRVVRYEYDPQRATQLLDGLGLTRGPDGFLRDTDNRRVTVEVIGAGGEANLRSVPIVADFWRRVGLEVTEAVVPIQRQRDYEWTANFPGFELSRRGADMRSLLRYHSSQAPIAERNFQGQNVPRYMNRELDALIERYHVTIPFAERIQVLSGIVRHMSDQLVLMTLFYDKEATMIGGRLLNVTKGLGSTQAWNAEAWDIR